MGGLGKCLCASRVPSPFYCLALVGEMLENAAPIKKSPHRNVGSSGGGVVDHPFLKYG